MRVVGGRHRGRRLAAPEGEWLRPTSDRAREAIFNILAHREDVTLEDAQVLDAFAGTGAMGIEALSRGAARATFMESDARAIGICRRNLRSLGEDANAAVIRADCLAPPTAEKPCSLVFLDPPYSGNLAAPALTALHAAGWIDARTLCSVELAIRDPFEPPRGFESVDDRHYGAARIVFVRLVSAPPE